MLTQEQAVEIRVMARRGEGIRAIAKAAGFARISRRSVIRVVCAWGAVRLVAIEPGVVVAEDGGFDGTVRRAQRGVAEFLAHVLRDLQASQPFYLLDHVVQAMSNLRLFNCRF